MGLIETAGMPNITNIRPRLFCFGNTDNRPDGGIQQRR